MVDACGRSGDLGIDASVLYASMAVIEEAVPGSTIIDAPCGGRVAFRALRLERYITGSLTTDVMGERPVLILTGAPGTGKTTTARILAERAPAAVHLETDAFFRFIRSGYIEPWRPESQAQNQVAMEIAGEAAAAYAAAGYFTVVEGIVLPRWFLAPLRGTLRKAGFRVVYAVLRVPLPLCLERVERRDGAVDRAAVTKIWTEFEDLGELEPNVLAVGDRSAEEIANTVEQALASGSHLV